MKERKERLKEFYDSEEESQTSDGFGVSDLNRMLGNFGKAEDESLKILNA